MISVEDLAKPISAEVPCGPDLAYDPAFQQLETLVRGKPETQFSAAEDPDWKELRDLSVAFHGRSKHLTAGVILTLSLLKTEGFAGLRDGLALVHRRRGGLGRGARRQVERALAAATAERKRCHAQDNDGPSRSCRAQLTDHDDIPKSGRTIQRLVWRGEANMAMRLQRNWCRKPYFRCFSSRFAQAFACANTLFGAVPPKLVRLFTEASTDSTFSASAEIFGSISCIAFKGSSCSATPSFAARATIRPVT